MRMTPFRTQFCRFGSCRMVLRRFVMFDIWMTKMEHMFISDIQLHGAAKCMINTHYWIQSTHGHGYFKSDKKIDNEMFHLGEQFVLSYR